MIIYLFKNENICLNFMGKNYFFFDIKFNITLIFVFNSFNILALFYKDLLK